MFTKILAKCTVKSKRCVSVHACMRTCVCVPLCVCACVSMRVCVCMCVNYIILSLSTVVLNSRDYQGKLWLPKNAPQKTTLKQYYHKKLSINVLVQPYKG